MLDGRITIKSNYYQDNVVLRVLCQVPCYADYPTASTGSMRLVDSDGDGMITMDEAASVRCLSNREDRNNSIFTGNTGIVSIRELRYFSGLNEIASCFFEGCTSLVAVDLPALPTCKSRVFYNCSSIQSIIVPEGVTSIGDDFISGCSSIRLVDLPSSLVSLGGSFSHGNRSAYTLVCRASTPPSFGGFGYLFVQPEGIYVPDGSVDAYKAAGGWIDNAAYIRPLSEYAG